PRPRPRLPLFTGTRPASHPAERHQPRSLSATPAPHKIHLGDHPATSLPGQGMEHAMPHRPATIWRRLPTTLRQQALEELARVVKEVIHEYSRVRPGQPPQPP